jgi:hypothetical protein
LPLPATHNVQSYDITWRPPSGPGKVLWHVLALQIPDVW